MKNVKFHVTDRGFIQMEPITCTYGSTVGVFESSSAESPHIWLDIKVDPNVLHDQPAGQGIAHLNFAQARELRDQLHWLIQNHYQVKVRKDLEPSVI